MLWLSRPHPHPPQLPQPHPHPTTLCSGPVGEDRFTACQLGPPHSPDYFDQFTHVDMVWDKELGLVQHWQLFLPFIAFDYDLGRKSMVGLATVYSAPSTGLKVKQTSTNGNIEIRPHFASPSPQENKRKDSRSDHQVGCRQLFSRVVCQPEPDSGEHP